MAFYFHNRRRHFQQAAPVPVGSWTFTAEDFPDSLTWDDMAKPSGWTGIGQMCPMHDGGGALVMNGNNTSAVYVGECDDFDLSSLDYISYTDPYSAPYFHAGVLYTPDGIHLLHYDEDRSGSSYVRRLCIRTTETAYDLTGIEETTDNRCLLFGDGITNNREEFNWAFISSDGGRVLCQTTGYDEETEDECVARLRSFDMTTPWDLTNRTNAAVSAIDTYGAAWVNPSDGLQYLQAENVYSGGNATIFNIVLYTLNSAWSASGGYAARTVLANLNLPSTNEVIVSIFTNSDSSKIVLVSSNGKYATIDIDTSEDPDPGQTPDLEDALITVAESVQYTGSPLTPTVTVVYSGTTLTENTDYTLSYSNNTNVGTATVTITGTGSYTGTVSKTFQITSSTPTPSGAWGQVTLANASLLSTTGNVNSGSIPFCVRGGYVFSSQSNVTVTRWVFDDEDNEFSYNGSVYTAQNGGGRGFCISRDGLHSYMYAKASDYSAGGVDTVYMYDHATAWNVSDASSSYISHNVKMPYALPKSSSSDEAVALDIDLTGAKIYAAMGSGLIHTNYLSTPFDVTTASESSLTTVNLNTVAGITNVRGMQVAPDGLRIALIDSSGIAYMLDLGTAWDMSTISAASKQTFDTGLSGKTIYGIGFSDDGANMFVKSSDNTPVRAYGFS